MSIAKEKDFIHLSPFAAGLDQSFSVTAIGSCRIVGPLRIMENSRPFHFNQSGVQGYSHSCREVRQHLSMLQSGQTVPEELKPVISPSTSHQSHTPSDLYVFELSSAKILTVGSHAVQLNYFNRHFAKFLDDRERSRKYWQLVKAGKQSELETFLSGEASFQALDEADQSILLRLRLEMTTYETLCADIAAIIAAVPAHLFVTHFDAKDASGELLKGRAEYLEMVRRALKACNANWFDPSEYVSALGQDAAVDQSTASLTHYSPAFEKLLAANWWYHHIDPVRQNRFNDRLMRRRIKSKALAVDKAKRLSSAPF